MQESSRNESGQDNFKGHMEKHNPSHLRQIITNFVDTFVLNNPVIYDYQSKKENTGELHRLMLPENLSVSFFI